MPLSAGTRLGPHEIVAPIGAGGMGEVYRAKDTRLDRTVAIKILPEHFSSNARRHERFEREARAISALNHPNICTLHDIGHQDGIDYLVMEYVQGETLGDRLRKGPLPPDQVLQYAIQIADALTTAHRRGVIHRDLKPGNIMLTKSGAKLLDFGLAKVAETGSARGLAVLATETSPLTAQGSILGTLQYMAPEQLEGRDADARTDLFAFGAVLYEMVTGRKAFEGRSHASLIAAILDQDPPPISARQPNPVPALDRVVKKALAKDPDNRWQTAIDLKDELKWIAETESSAPSFVSHTKSHARRDWLARVALLIGLLAALWITFRYLPGRQTVESALRFSVPLPTGTRFTSTDTVGPTPQIAVSPDGRMITFAASYPGHPAFLWLRKLDSFEPQMLPGTEGASFPFWSQDSRFLGFFARGKLKKLDVSNPIPQVIVDAPDGRGGAWNRHGVIVFAEGISSGLKQVSAAGGIPIPATVLDKSRGELSHRFPQFLPDGQHFVYVNRAAEKHLGLYVGSLGSKETKRILTGKWSNAYAAGDYLISVREGTLIAHPFNRKRLEVAARQFSVAEQVASSSAVRLRIILSFFERGFGLRQWFVAEQTASVVQPRRRPTWARWSGRRIRIPCARSWRTKAGFCARQSADKNTGYLVIRFGPGHRNALYIRSRERACAALVTRWKGDYVCLGPDRCLGFV